MNREEISRKLQKFIEEELIHEQGYQIKNEEPLITGGLIDSYSLAHIGVFVEETFGQYIPDTELTVENFDTLKDMVDFITLVGMKNGK